MNFKKIELTPKIIWIIDIGTYKIKVSITKYHNKNLELIWYWEKRQDNNTYLQNNVKLLCENITEAIKKAEQDWNTVIEEIIINFPFWDIFFETAKINHIRKNTENEIDKEELGQIINEVKDISLRKAFENIKINYTFDKENLKLIISNITNILVDKNETKKLIGKNPKEVNISILNVFIPRTKYELIESIWRSIDKKIIKILPWEYCIAKLDYNKKDLVIIDLWNTFTSVIVKENNNIIWVKKVAIWIQDLIKEISNNHKKTRIEVINSIDENLYLEEKKWFLDIFEDIISITLEDILWDKICPNNFFMIWWWSNKFIKNHLQNLDFNKLWIKMIQKINFADLNSEHINDINSSKSNLNIYSIMKCSQEFIKREKDPIEDLLKEIMSEF